MTRSCRIAEQRAFRPHWSADILTELSRVLVREAGLSEDQAQHRVDQMQRAFPDAEVAGYERLIAALTCDPKDRHVLAAAVHSHCEVLVTFNLKDFPEASTLGLDVTVVSPDNFLLDQLDLYPAKVGRAPPRPTPGVLAAALDHGHPARSPPPRRRTSIR